MLRTVQNYTAAFFLLFRAFLAPESQLLSAQKWVLGLVNLTSVIVFWVGSSFLVNDLFETNVYRKPFFITWINNSCFVFYLVPYLRQHGYSVLEFARIVSQDYRASQYDPLKDAESGPQPLHTYGASRDVSSEDLTAESLAVLPKKGSDDVGICETLMLSLQFVVLWFSANLVTNAWLSYTSVALQTILLSTLSFFTLIFGYFYRIEKINRNKIAGIVLSFSGVLLVTKIDSLGLEDLPEDSTPFFVLWGNALALSGALIYGIYTILLKHKITIPGTTHERTFNTHLFFGFVGLYSLVLLWPVLVVLHFTGVEKFGLPDNAHVIKLLCLNAFITFISDFCWCKAVLLTSPLTVTVGLSLTIPLAMIGDWVFKGFHVHFWYLFGALIVTLGFFVINKDEKQDFTEDEVPT
ncbi:hypothetical protein METBIDRAFT_39144 [Metschnikowia bicuspidata var. bicuspidata NRRL YB-4993]|uniref:EamA domain-containing protein n=1 Tax=Metschnikowia bicuspidata var. bicuspidata NRRL YB-4993 TaxID=869754 RepID=A0A1A0HER5_9ASCO|nr:hypothetical protein METBIDRAFT_39144 [Metschnikowia bicuspidata var. bicuspidata NRRL YB-4993]OBA22465.1 hypothetical protein METBIDRAFT_39144 [Metschnikowia bicuspidata var. bicuspidata NRRL YB-4993]